MEHNNLIDREHERQFLEKALATSKAQLIVIYGRRRVGKSFLTSNFVREKKGIYYLCSKGNDKEQLELLSYKLAEYFGDPTLKTNPFTKWHTFFTYIIEKTKQQPFIIEFDEFPFLINANAAIPSLFQKYWDEHLHASNIYIILCGSSIGMMETEVLGYRSPLYGRRTGQWRLDPLPIKHIAEFFSEKTPFERIVETYAVSGGMPYYLTIFDLGKSAIENIMEYIAAKGQPLFEEGEALIREELPDAMTYFSMLHAMAKGETKQADIANHIGMPATAITRYLANLQRLGFIEKIIPVTEKKTSKKSLYFISDNFLNFWFRFVYPNKGYVEGGDNEKIKQILKTEFTMHVSTVFEEICKQAIWQLIFSAKLNFKDVGSWWGSFREAETNERKTAEIDIVSINKEKREILFAECKWQDRVNAQHILNSLKEKAKLVNWYNAGRKEYFTIFAKSFKEKKTLEDNVFLFDLKDLERIFRS